MTLHIVLFLFSFCEITLNKFKVCACIQKSFLKMLNILFSFFVNCYPNKSCSAKWSYRTAEQQENVKREDNFYLDCLLICTQSCENKTATLPSNHNLTNSRSCSTTTSSTTGATIRRHHLQRKSMRWGESQVKSARTGLIQENMSELEFTVDLYRSLGRTIAVCSFAYLLLCCSIIGLSLDWLLLFSVPTRPRRVTC